MGGQTDRGPRPSGRNSPARAGGTVRLMALAKRGRMGIGRQYTWSTRVTPFRPSDRFRRAVPWPVVRHDGRQGPSMCYVIQKTAPGRGAVDGQKEDEGQGDQERRSEEGHQDGEYQAQDREGCEEAAPAGCQDIPTGARGPQYRRVAGKHGPAPRLVAVSLLDALIPNRITSAAARRSFSPSTASVRPSSRPPRRPRIPRPSKASPTMLRGRRPTVRSQEITVRRGCFSPRSGGRSTRRKGADDDAPIR